MVFCFFFFFMTLFELSFLFRSLLLLFSLSPRSLVEDDDAHMKVALGYGDMGISAHLQASKTGNTRFFTSNTHSSVVLQVRCWEGKWRQSLFCFLFLNTFSKLFVIRVYGQSCGVTWLKFNGRPSVFCLKHVFSNSKCIKKWMNKWERGKRESGRVKGRAALFPVSRSDKPCSENIVRDAAYNVKTRQEIKINHPLLFPFRSSVLINE